jgi:hypothetical protein
VIEFNVERASSGIDAMEFAAVWPIGCIWRSAKSELCDQQALKYLHFVVSGA